MNKRHRDLNNGEDDESHYKIRKVDSNTSYNENDCVDLDDSDDEVILVEEKYLTMNDSDKDSAYLSNTVTSENNVSNGNKKISNKANEHFDANNETLMSELFSQFSEDDDNEETIVDSDHGGSNLSNQQTSSSSSSSNKNQILNEKENCRDSSLCSGEIKFEDTLNFNYDDWENEECDFDFYKFTRCKIVDIQRQRLETRLTVEGVDSFKRATVICSGSWRDVKIEMGEMVVIKAEKMADEWKVNNDFGMIVTQPDELVAGTTVVQGIFCERKGVLMQKYSGINSLPNIPADDAVMICGIIVHEFLQTALEKKIYDIDSLRKLLDTILQYPHIVQILYNSNLTVKAIKEMVNEYVIKVSEFINRYILGVRQEVQDKNFQGKIECVRDIEEDVWLPSLGVKGKVDVTVEVSFNKCARRVLPLEIKTGRALFSHEHKGQLHLYCMMMENLGYKLNSGLLLYIKENQMREIRSTIHEKRDLILLRNSLAYYLSRNPYVVEKKIGKNEKIKAWTLPELPEPINHSVGCKRCPFNTICCVYAKEEKLEFQEEHHYNEILKEALAHLTHAHIEYVVNWISMLQIENAHNKSIDANRIIWSQKPVLRETQQTCLSYLKIVEPVKQEKNGFHHTFVRASIKDLNIKLPVRNFKDVFDIEDYIMINTCTRINIVTGKVMAISKDSITVSLRKDIVKWGAQTYYHIDAVVSMTMPYQILGTVATLLADNDITRRLRKMIIDKIPAQFSEEIPESLETKEAKSIMEHLNKFQQEALRAAVQTKDYLMIKGMPGTGKTQTLVALIELLSSLGYSVLISAHTHIAVDNILLKLHDKGMNFLRIGSKIRIHQRLHKYSDEDLLKQCKTPEVLESKYNKIKIVGVTCLGSNHSLLARRMFDYCVVDECTQILQPIIIRPLFNAEKYVIVGDPDQLSAVIKSNEARKLGMDQDMFSRLDSKNNTRVLKQQYRMNKPIMDLANDLTYKGELLMGNDKVSNATLQFTNTEILESCEEWVKTALLNDLEHAVVVLNTQELRNLNSKPHLKNFSHNYPNHSTNYIEAGIVLRLLNVLIQAGVRTNDIGIIAPFTGQVNLLKRLVRQQVEINTVDQYQGRDKSVIMLSCTKNDVREYYQTNEYEILEDYTRLNVALTRAKHKLIIIGNKLSLIRYTPFQKLFNLIKKNEMVLKNDSHDFSWDQLSQLLDQ